MTDFFAWLLSTRFMPHGHCLLWDSDVVLLHVVSDSLITLAYYSIPLTLLHFTRRRQDLPYPWVFYCFGAFIVACGTTHLIGVVNVWVPAYRLDGMVKAVTASLSVTTAAILIPLVPKALALRSPVQLEEANEQLDAANRRLAAANRALEQEVARRQDVERELQATSDDLRRSNVELEQFAYVASHDLQEPLRGITGCIQILGRRYRGRLDESADELIRHSVEGAERMQSLIQDLLAYSRVTSRGRALEPVACDDVVRLALANLEQTVLERDAKVEVGELPVVIGDRTQLTQLFQNLIGNAIKFTTGEPPEVTVAAAPAANGFWEISVRDRGIGIDPQYHERIFRIFQRLHTRDEYEGTGIGLALCQRIVERHGGKITVESAPGEGSTFRFTLRAEARA
jgi:signal transduction histidine kinase